MINRDIIKKVVDNKININGIYSSINDKIEKDNRKNKTIGYSLLSIFIVGVIYVVFLYNGKDSQLDNNIIKENGNKVYVNETIVASYDIDGLGIDMDFDKVSFEYGLTDLTLPEGVIPSRSLFIYTRDLESNNLEYDILHDYVFLYNNSDNSKEIDIAFSRVGKPLRCYRYDINVNKSIINNYELVIYGTNKSYNVIFKYNNYNFDIMTRNISLEELVNLLESILV